MAEHPQDAPSPADRRERGPDRRVAVDPAYAGPDRRTGERRRPR